MDNRINDEGPLDGCLGYIVGAVIGLILCWLLASCGSSRVITNTIVKRDTVRMVQMQKDSTWVHDSVFVDRWMQGDTCFITKYREHTLWKDRWKIDTVYISKIDSVTNVKEVEKKMTTWQKWQMALGDVFLLVVMLALMGLGLWSAGRFK